MVNITMVEREWDIKRITETLKISGEPVSDFLRGEGVALSYPSTGAKLELYPEKLAMRYRAGDFRLDMTNVIGFSVTKNGLQIRAGLAETPTLFTLRPDGSVNVAVTKVDRPQTSQEAVPLAATSAQSLSQETVPASTESAQKEEAAEKDRVTLTGRVGREPSSRTTPNGRLVVRVPLAVHEGEETKWHQLVFFDDLGRKVAEGIHKGELLSVIGYRHTREVKPKVGESRQVEEVYGAIIQTSNTPPTSS